MTQERSIDVFQAEADRMRALARAAKDPLARERWSAKADEYQAAADEIGAATKGTGEDA